MSRHGLHPAVYTAYELFPGCGIRALRLTLLLITSCHIFYNQRVVNINNGKPKWTGANNKSELMLNGPAGSVNKRRRHVEAGDD